MLELGFSSPGQKGALTKGGLMHTSEEPGGFVPYDSSYGRFLLFAGV